MIFLLNVSKRGYVIMSCRVLSAFLKLIQLSNKYFRNMSNKSENSVSRSKRRKITDSNEENISEKSQRIRLNDDFYNVDCKSLATRLLGKILCRKLSSGAVVQGKIVETECYPGGEDKASYSYNGRRTQANEPMYMKPGTTFVYMTYGMYHCFNISSDGDGSAVLLRAVEPMEGLEYMQNSRKTKKRMKELKVEELCNGPSKLCMSFNINKTECNKLDLADSDLLWIEDYEDVNSNEIVTSTRIGIDSCGKEWAEKPYRFYILGNESVSKRDKIVEEMISERLKN